MASEIPIYRSQLVKTAINNSSSGPGYSEEAEYYEKVSENIKDKVISLSLENSFNKYKNLAQEQILDSYNKYKNDPEKLSKELEFKTKDLLSGTFRFSPIRNQLESFIKNNSLGFISKAQSNQIEYLNNNLKKESLSLIENNIKSSIDIAGNIFSEDEQIRNNTLNTIYANLSNIKETTSLIGEDGLPLFTANQQLSAEENFISHISKASITQKYETLESIEDKEKFLKKLKNGELETPSILNNGEINSIQNFIEKDIDATRKLLLQQSYYENFKYVDMGEAVPLNGVPAYDKLVNDQFISMIPELNNSPIEIAVPKIVDFISKHGMPNSAISMTKSWLKMGDEDQVRKVVELMDSIEHEAPDAASKLDGKDLAFSRDILSSLRNGISFKKAYETTKEKYNPVNYEQNKLLETEFNKEVAGADWFDLSVKGINSTTPFWKSNIESLGVPKIDASVSIDFRNKFKEQYMLTRDIDQALKNTNLYMSNTYSGSIVNNGKITKNPPEKFYGIKGVDNYWIREQFESTAKALSEYMGIKNQDNLKNAFIVSDQTTETEIRNGDQPSYAIYLIDDSGSYVYINSTRFKPDSSIVQNNINENNKRFERFKEKPIYATLKTAALALDTIL